MLCKVKAVNEKKVKSYNCKKKFRTSAMAEHRKSNLAAAQLHDVELPSAYIKHSMCLQVKDLLHEKRLHDFSVFFRFSK